jgi:nickel-dependent lactate racemase
MIRDPRATWGVTSDGNPVWEEMLEVALATNPTFLLNVTLNSERQITGVFAGDLQEAHATGREFCRRSSMVEVPQLYDIVVTTNSGYPLDQNLYQTVKGMSAAARIVKPGGAIILAAECSDGLPDHGEYAALLRSAADPAELLERVESPDFSSHDQWQVQIQAMVQKKAAVHVYSGGLSDEQIRQALLIPCPNIEARVAELGERFGPDASICVLPEGPQTVCGVRRDLPRDGRDKRGGSP